jgi:WD40 repeat protein
MADAFVSYSRRDKDLVERLNAALEGRDRDVWVDWEDIPPTADWLAQIRSGIEEANALIFVISPDSIASEVCVTELGVAEELNKRIVPLLVREVDPGNAPDAVARANWIFFDDLEKFDQSVDTLVEALDTDLDHVNAHTRLLVQAQRWERDGRDRSLLIRGTELTAAEAWLDAASTGDEQPAPLPLQAEFIRASREATARRQRITVAAVSVALVVAIALAIVALVQRSHAIDQRNAATARELDAQAQNQYDIDPELSVLLATEAADTDPGDATEEALRQALGRSHVIATYHSPRGAPDNALFSPRGGALLIADGDDTARIRSPAGGAPPIELEAPGLSGQIAWSGDGRAVATGGPAPAVWDARAGERIVALPADSAFGVALDEHATRVAIVGGEGDGRVFSVPAGRKVASFQAPVGHGALPSCFDASADLGVIAQCNDVARPAVFVWNGRTGEPMRTLRLRGAAPRVDVSDDGALVGVAAVGSGDNAHGGRIAIVPTAAGGTAFADRQAGSAIALSPAHDDRFALGRLPSLAEVVRTRSGADVPLTGHTDTIRALAFGVGDSRLVTGSVDGTARIWDTAGEQLELLAGHRSEVTSVSYSADGELVATTSPDGDTRVWATDKPLPERSVPHPDGAVAVLAADPDGAGRLLYVGPGPEAKILDPETLQTDASIPLPEGPDALGADWSADGSLIVVATAEPKGVLNSMVAADPEDPESTQEIRPDDGLGAAAAVSGGRLLTISSAGELELWNGLTGESIRTYDVDASGAAIAVSKAGDRAGLLAPDGEINVVDIDGGDVVQTIDGPAPRPQTGGIPAPFELTFDPDGQRLATYGGDPTVRIWDVESGALERTLKGGESYFRSVGWSPDGELLGGGDTNGVYLWSTDSGAVVQHLQHSDPGTFGTTLVPGLGVGTAFSLDGTNVLSVGNGTVSLWSAETGERLFHNPLASVGTLSADGGTILTGNASDLDRYACGLCGDLGDLLSYARESVTRDFTEAERNRYLHD